MIFALDISSDDHGFASSVFYQATGFFRVVILAPTTIKFTKLETSVIGKGMIARLLNIEETLAKTAAAKLGVVTMPEPADGAAPPRDDLDPFPALGIIKRGPRGSRCVSSSSSLPMALTQNCFRSGRIAARARVTPSSIWRRETFGREAS
jgi:hypothetical protein